MSSGRIAPFAEGFGQRSGDVDRVLAIARNPQSRGMEKHRTARNSVNAIAEDPAPERFARVDADLVRASRHGAKLDQSGAIADSNAPPVRCRLQAMIVFDHPPSRLGARGLAERHVDRAVRL